MPSTRSQRAQLADPLDAPRRRRGRSASVTSTDTSTPAPRAAPKRKTTRSSRQASVASSVVSEEPEEEALVTTETVIVEVRESEPEPVARQDAVPSAKKKRTLRDRQFDEEVERARAARIAAEAAIAAAAEQDRRDKQERTPQRSAADQRDAIQDKHSYQDIQSDENEELAESMDHESATAPPPQIESQPQVEPQATPKAANPGLLRRIFGGFASPWRTSTPLHAQQPPATQPIFRFGEAQAQETPTSSNTSQQQPATQPVRKFKEARGPSTQTKSTTTSSRSSVSKNASQQARQPNFTSMESQMEDVRDDTAPPQVQQSPTPTARQENKRKRAGSEPPLLETITESPEVGMAMNTPSRAPTSFYETELLTRTAPRPSRAGLIPRPTPRRTIKSVREAREARQSTSAQASIPAWSRTTSTVPRDKNADRRIQRLHEMQILQQQQKENEERLSRLKAEEEADRPKRTKRVKVDELKWIPARRPGESSGTFRVPDFDSDDEIEVDEDEEMLDNPFDIANAPPTPAPKPVEKKKSAPAPPAVVEKPSFAPPQPQPPQQKSQFQQPPPQPQHSIKAPSPPVQPVPGLVSDAEDTASEDEWPEMPLAAPAWAFTEKEKAEGLAAFEAGLEAFGM